MPGCCGTSRQENISMRHVQGKQANHNDRADKIKRNLVGKWNVSRNAKITGIVLTGMVLLALAGNAYMTMNQPGSTPSNSRHVTRANLPGNSSTPTATVGRTNTTGNVTLGRQAATTPYNPPAPRSVPPSNYNYTHNNKVLVTKNGRETTEKRLQLIREAKQSIEISGNFGGGNDLHNLLKELEDAIVREPKIKIHVMFSDTFVRDDHLHKFDALQSMYPDNFKYLITPTLTKAASGTTEENHWKTTIIDRKWCFVGGTGIVDYLTTPGDKPASGSPNTGKFLDNFLPSAARDMDVIIEGPTEHVSAEYFDLFQRWESVSTDSAPNRFFEIDHNAPKAQASFITEDPNLVGTAKVKLVTCGPHHEENACTKAYVDLINNAKSSITIAHMHLNLPKEIDEALMKKVNHVDLKIITNGLGNIFGYGSNQGFSNNLFATTHTDRYVDLMDTNLFPKVAQEHAATTRAETLSQGPLETQVKSRTEIREFDVAGTLMHKKVMVVDGRYIIIGSYNLGFKSDKSDDEILVVIDDPRLAKQVEEILKQDMKLSEPVTHEKAVIFEQLLSCVGTAIRNSVARFGA